MVFLYVDDLDDPDDVRAPGCICEVDSGSGAVGGWLDGSTAGLFLSERWDLERFCMALMAS